MALPLLPLIQLGVSLFTGQSEERDSRGQVIKQATKGLIRSKTATLAHSALVGKIVAVWGLPGINDTLRWGLTAAVFLEWAAQLYLRVVTKDPV